MNLLDAPAGFDDPIAMWMGCHRRIERQLDTLQRLSRHLTDHGVDPEASSAAQAVLRYFEKAGTHHHEDEDGDLFPLLEKRILDAGDLRRFRTLRAALEEEHLAMQACWSKLRKTLEGIADGLPKSLPAKDVEEFRALYARHIPAEEAEIPELAVRYLSSDDVETLGRAMAARRGVSYPV
jgi:hemerythrin-like domain-containing protein